MPRTGLNTDQVVAAATALVDAEGPGALSLSALSQRLGVKSPSLYVHVSGLEDLRRRVAMLAAEDLGAALAPAAAGLARGDALAAIGHAYRTWALAHPGQYAMIETGQSLGSEPAVERVLALILAVLRGYGLDGDTAIHAARTVRASLHGFINLEARVGFEIPVDREVSFDWMLAALDRGLSTTPQAASPDGLTPG